MVKEGQEEKSSEKKEKKKEEEKVKKQWKLEWKNVASGDNASGDHKQVVLPGRTTGG